MTSFPVDVGEGEPRVITTTRTPAPRPPRQPRQPGQTTPPVPPVPSEHRGRYTFTIGNGGATIELESFGGSIQLVRPGELTRRSQNERER
jgi:hypothetical protein